MTNGRATGISEEKDRETGQERGERRGYDENCTLLEALDRAIMETDVWPISASGQIITSSWHTAKFEYRIVLDTIFTTREFSTYHASSNSIDTYSSRPFPTACIL